MKKIIFQKEKINIPDILARVGTPADGCIVNFIGMPRNSAMEKTVQYLEYEIYESMAYKEMDTILSSAMTQWPITDCIVVHRYGKVEISEPSIVTALSSPHRNDAYEASRYIIDMIKKTVPIWKKEVFIDGTHWVSDRM